MRNVEKEFFGEGGVELVVHAGGDGHPEIVNGDVTRGVYGA